jgi:hypothetical protein
LILGGGLGRTGLEAGIADHVWTIAELLAYRLLGVHNREVMGMNQPEPFTIPLLGVRELTEGYPVELTRDSKTGRLAILARNEGGCNITEVDLLDMIGWLRLGPIQGRVEGGFRLPLTPEE